MTQQMIGIIGGSGLGYAMEELIQDSIHNNVQTPFGPPSSDIITGRIGDRPVAFLNRHGRGHRFSPSNIPYQANIFALKKLGVRSLIATAAVGSLRDHFQPGHLVMPDQFIDKTFKRPNTFFDDFGVVHCEFAKPTCSRLTTAIHQPSAALNLTCHMAATYVCMEGPQFSTCAESLMHRSWGGDIIGMTAMPEAKLAREAQLCYSLIALISDYDCWRPQKNKTDKQTLLAEIISNLNSATENCLKLLKTVLASPAILTDDQCHCRHSLDIAVWTKPEQIDPKKKNELNVLFE